MICHAWHATYNGNNKRSIDFTLKKTYRTQGNPTAASWLEKYKSIYCFSPACWSNQNFWYTLHVLQTILPKQYWFSQLGTDWNVTYPACWFLTHSTPDFSRRHYLHPFSQKLRCRWENIWRKVVHFNKLNNDSSNLFQNMSCWTMILQICSKICHPV
jgi:hypothetical protein